MRHIAVIGAGITGVTTAYSLARRGYAVTVFDRERYAAMETSFANGGQLSASNAEVWNSWATVMKGMKWMLRADAPLLMNPKPSWHKYSWMAEFIANIPNYRANTIATVRMALEARAHMFAIAEREGFDFNLEKRGILHIYRDKTSFDHAARVSELYAEGGLERRSVTPEEMRALEPTLHGDYYGGFFTPSDATGDIHKFTRGLADACVRLGVTFEFEADVTAVTRKDRGVVVSFTRPAAIEGAAPSAETAKFNAVVMCAGHASRRFAASLGDRINIYPVKGYSITVELNDEESRAAAPWVSLLDDHTKIVSSRLGTERFRIAGTAEFNGENQDIRADRIRPLTDWVRHLFPGVSTDRVLPWSGLRPMLPSMLPRVGPGVRPGVYYNTGHGHLGWTLSAATAETIADIVNAEMPAETAPAVRETRKAA
ncbi:MAG TPA: D-amino acid dehydrogenase [Xanthobacteraceae bacterium]|nr:D-amino acid dehydrogenase [Xanthobacteraceae bacterium]